MTITAPDRPPATFDRPTNLRLLVQSFIELPVQLSGPGCEPWHAPLLDGYINATAAVLTDGPIDPTDFAFLRQVHEAFIGLVGAVEEEAEFLRDDETYLGERRLPLTADVRDRMTARLEADLEFWTEKLMGLAR